MTDVPARLRNCFTAVFGELDGRDMCDASPETVEGWDSLANLSLVTVIEEEFQIQVPPEDIDHFVSFGRIQRYLEGAAQAV